jgi:hypothetical protein
MKQYKLILIFGILLISNIVFAQNYIYHGKVKYESTPVWTFNLKENYWTNHSIDLCIGKTKTGGCILISIETPYKQAYIGGKFTLYLSDGSVIQCIDRKNRSRLNNRSYNLYNLTFSEIEKLKIYKIESVVFGIAQDFLGIDYYEADNRYHQDTFKRYSNMHINYLTDITLEYNTEEEITELFDSN